MARQYDTDQSACNHRNVNIVNLRPDRLGETMYDGSDEGGGIGFRRMHAHDARCEDCGAEGNVIFSFERLERFDE
jgi:hypothetical protein